MKLKLLVVPSAVVIAIFVIIWHIWPAWFSNDLAGNIVSLKKEIKTSQTEIMDLSKKKESVSRYSQAAENNILKDFVSNYYPIVRKEEDIINNINTIAFGEGIFLLDMGIEYKEIGATDDPMVLMSLPAIKKRIDETPIDGSVAPVVDPALDTEAVWDRDIKFIESNLKIKGTYAQMKSFLVALNRVGLLNNLESFSIEKDTQPASQADEKAGVEKNKNSLVAEVKFGFGYMKNNNRTVAELLKRDAFGEAGEKIFNGKVEDILSNDNLLAEKYTPSEIGNAGAADPFFAKEAESL